MKDRKSVKTPRSYDAEFKQELIRMLVSGRSAREISEGFGIAENVLYRWRRMATKKTSGKNDKDKAAKLAAEVAKLREENERLKTDREILKKAAGRPRLGLLSQSDSWTSIS